MLIKYWVVGHNQRAIAKGMGNEPSNQSDGSGAAGNQPGWEVGLRVLNTKPNSPARDAGLVPFQDFIVGIEEHVPGFSIRNDFSPYVSHKENQDCWVLVHNCFTGVTRSVNLQPRRTWEGADSLLGVKLRTENIPNAISSVAKISAVTSGSPAYQANIVPDRDYLIGCIQFDFRSIEEFSTKLQLFMGIEADPSLDLYIVDIGTLQGRLVKVKPNNLWKGANSLLGIEFGVGIFDTRLLRELLEKKGKAAFANPDGSETEPSERPVMKHDDHYLQYYFQTKSVSGQPYNISSHDIFPSLSFPLREFIYKA